MAAISARDGVDDGMSNPRGTTMVIVNTVMVVLSTLLVMARLYTRFSIHRHFGLDDWFILSVVPISITMTGLYFGEAKNGFGLHMDYVSRSHFEDAWKFYIANQVLYKAGVCLTKTSLLFLYLRIFQSQKFRIGVWVAMFVVVGSAIGTIVPTIFQCVPIEKAWKPELPGHCIFLPAIWYASSSLSIITDICIIILPLTQIPSLKLPKGQKIGLGVLFSMGIFVIMTTVVRITTLGPSTTSKDQTYYQSETNLWLGIDVNVSIIIATIPPLKAPIAAFFPRLFLNSTLRSSSNDRDRSRTKVTGARASMPPNPITSKNYSVTAGTRNKAMVGAGDSDEEIMLHSMQMGITKKRDIEITYSESL